MNYSFKNIAEIVDGVIIHPHKESVNTISTDSRRVYRYQGNMFVALKGPSHDGHQYIPELISRRIRSFLIDKSFNTENTNPSAGFIQVTDTLEAFQKLAAYHRNTFSGNVLAISGSNGKTVVKEWASQLLAKVFSVQKNPKSYNSQVGVPSSVLMMDSGPDYHILEAGISKPGEMFHLENILHPEFGILTNLGGAHQENFESFQAKLEEKLLLFRNSQCLFYNKDNDLVAKGVESFFKGCSTKTISWSLFQNADLKVNLLSSENGRTIASGLFNSKTYELKIPFSDPASIENVIQIWLFWLYNDLSPDVFQKGVLELEAVAMRLEQKEGQRGCTLINDFYNADLHSLSIAIDLLINQLPQENKTLIFSDLLQTGLKEAELINRINLLIKDKDLFRIIGIGPLFTNNRAKFEFIFESYIDTDTFLKDFPLSRFNNEAILLKGARRFRFEKISRKLEKRVHNTIVEVNMSSLLDNLNYFRSKLSEGTRIMAMVKAASYGSGTHEIAKFLAHQRIDYLGVAFVDEGVQLRESGVDVPIMVMNPGLDSLETLIEYHLEPEVFSFELLKAFHKEASLAGIKGYPVHLKIDTGMHRLGFQPNEIDGLMKFLEDQEVIVVRSVFSHLASADNKEKDKFTHMQAKSFSDIVRKLRSRIRSSFFVHLDNTAAILRFPEYHFDMVRLGIGLYGVDPSGMVSLEPVISLKSNITQIHELEKGELIGYGNSGVMKSDGKIAIIPVGYADGFDRRLGNRLGRVFCNGKMAAVVGRVCMDMIMVDVTDMDVSVGDQVTLIGAEISLDEIAEKLNTIPYEILTRIPQRVRRVYLFC